MNYQIPIPPFYGNKILAEIDLNKVFPFLNEKFLFLKLWGFRKKSLSESEYKKAIEEHAKPALKRLKNKFLENSFCKPQAIFGFYKCHSTPTALTVYNEEVGKEEKVLFHLPREKKIPFRSILDFFKPYSQTENDLIIFQIVTIGSNIKNEDEKLIEKGSYKDYFYKHGFSMALTEALADYVQDVVKKSLFNINENDTGLKTDPPSGLRFSPGFSSCPSLEDNKKIIDLLQAQKIGITVTETFQMVPEYTTAAFIVLNPAATYF